MEILIEKEMKLTKNAVRSKICPNISRLKRPAMLVITLILLSLSCFSQVGDPSPLTFPKPGKIPNMLFYLQRDPNINTVIYSLNISESGILDQDRPVNVYWIRYAEKSVKKELSYIQQKFAFGVESRKLSSVEFEFHLTSYKKLLLYLKKSPQDSSYHVFTTVNNSQIQLDRIFVRIKGGTLFKPNIAYIDLEGKHPVTGKLISERIPF